MTSVRAGCQLGHTALALNSKISSISMYILRESYEGRISGGFGGRSAGSRPGAYGGRGSRGQSVESDKVQGDQLNIAVFFWYLVKSDLSSIRYCTRVHWTIGCTENL